MLAMNASSLSSTWAWPPIAVFTIGTPKRSAQRTTASPCSSPSRVVRSEWPLIDTASSP